MFNKKNKIIKRILSIVALLLPLFFICCSKEKDEVQEEKANTLFEVIVYDDMDLSRTQVSDGNLYNVTLGTSQGEVLEIGNVKNGKSVKYTMPDGYTEDDCFLFFLKLSPNGNDLHNQGYILLFAGQNPVLFPLKKGKPTEIHITENTICRISNYTKKGDLMNILQAAGL